MNRRAVVIGSAWVGVAALAAPAALAQGNVLDRLKSLEPALPGAGRSGSPAGALSTDEIGRGLKEALRVGTERVVGTLGRPDGFLGSKDVHIPLPGALQTVQSALRRVGQSGLADDLETRLNRAAEAAVPKAKELFWNAIAQMSLDDVQAIYKGPPDAATRYFQGKMSAPLGESMRPVVDRSLAEAGAVQSYDRMMGAYRSLPFVPDAKADLSRYVVGKSTDAVFLYLGREEAAIRQNPGQRTTDLLKRVFGT